MLALPVFWVLSPPQAMAVYAPVLLLSLLLYWKTYQAMSLKVATGKEALIGAAGRVIAAERPSRPKVMVRSEIWDAVSTHPLAPGESIVVLGFRGLRLVVDSAQKAPVSALEPPAPGCHG
ncbi:MAG: NfeD family protein [Deltaproteobacteria bacterium]|nr:NfeD family protein [Deltaproteobacteria bacterium]